MSLARKDVFQASKILIDFLRDFTSLSEQQLLSTRKMMEGIVSQVMDSMMLMNEKTSMKKDGASEVLVKDTNSGAFVSSTVNAVETKEDAPGAKNLNRTNVLESKLLRNSGMFSKHLEAISTLDSNVQQVLASIVGSVSVDDVISQRLGHVILSLQTLQKALTQFLGDYKAECSPDRVKLLRNKVLTEVYLSYSSEEEREIFHKIFGHPRAKKSKAS